jgi:predicted O-linked N-acetylglucosamine transferase (SPINDLY family)
MAGRKLSSRQKRERKKQAKARGSRSKPSRAPSVDVQAVLEKAAGLHQAGQVDQAADLYRQVLDNGPDNPCARNLLGVALAQQGQLDDAYQSIARATRAAPDYADAHYNLGRVCEQLGRADEAARAYQSAANAQPDHPQAHFNLANVFRAQGRLDEAVSAFQQALSVTPNNAAACLNLGNTWRDLGQLDQAESAYSQAIQIDNHYAEAYSNLGVVRRQQFRLDEAVDAYRQAIRLRPDYAEAHFNLGRTLRESNRLDEAAAELAKAVDLRPQWAEALSELTYLRRRLCEWQDLADVDRRLLDAIDADAGAVQPFVSLFLPTTARQQLRCAQQWARDNLPPGDALPAPPSAVAKDRLVVGYLSADFHEHATAYLAAGLFEHHDRERFAVHAYSYGPTDGSPMRQRLIDAFDEFVEIGHLSDEAAAQVIRDDGVDILIDLKGYTRDARPDILAHRPAAVQLAYLGYPATMGWAGIDGAIVDEYVVPPAAGETFSEALVYLPDCYQVTDGRRPVGDRSPKRSDHGLPDDALVLCSFNGPAKLTPQVFDIWMRLLKRHRSSVLWLLDAGEQARENLRRQADQRGVDPDRLVFAPFVSQAEHLGRFSLADLMLDTFPVTAHTTASDALWAGCPLLTCAGETFASRVAGSVLLSAGLDDCVADSLQAYQSKAEMLLADPQALGELRQRVAEARSASALFDTARFTRNMERVLRECWQRREKGELTGLVRADDG